MKDFIIVLVLKLAKAGMKFLYLFIKLFTRKKNKILMLSRQSNSVNLDFDSSSLTIFITPTIESVAGQTVTFDEPVVIKQKPINV